MIWMMMMTIIKITMMTKHTHAHPFHHPHPFYEACGRCCLISPCTNVAGSLCLISLNRSSPYTLASLESTTRMCRTELACRPDKLLASAPSSLLLPPVFRFFSSRSALALHLECQQTQTEVAARRNGTHASASLASCPSDAFSSATRSCFVAPSLLLSTESCRVWSSSSSP